MKIAVLVLNWENANSTINCINSLLESKLENGNTLSTFIIDNNSTQETRTKLFDFVSNLQELSPNIHYIQNERNLGFSGGMNQAIKAAMSLDEFDYFWLLNNDLVVDQNALKDLLSYTVQHPGKLVIGPTVLNIEGNTIQCAGGCKYNSYLGFATALYSGVPVEKLLNLKEQKLDYVYGAAMFIKSSVFKSDLLDERFFLYFEELSLKQNLPDKENNLGWCKNAIVRHHGGGSSTSSDIEYFTTYHAARSCFHYTYIHHKPKLPIVILSRVIGKFVQSILQGKMHLLTPSIKAIFHFLKGKTIDVL